MRTPFIALLSPLVLLSPGLARAQSEAWRIHGQTSGGAFGSSVAFLGDVDGDGVPDYVGGAPSWMPSPGIGHAIVGSGADGSILLDVTGPVGALFGATVANAGDVDGDGHCDFAVGAPLDGNGSVSIYSGATGALLHSITGATAASLFGSAIANLGDLDGDGVDDLAIGAPNDSSGGTQLGLAAIYSGATGNVLAQFAGATVGGGFGGVLDDAGDVDMDGVHDLLVVEQSDTSLGAASGTLRIYSGANFTKLREWTLGAHAGDWIASGAGDVNGDGVADVIVGNSRWPSIPILPYENGVGEVVVLDGSSGAALYTINGPTAMLYQTGGVVSSAGDVDGDGFADFAFSLVAAFSSDQMRILSGKNGSVLAASTSLPRALRGGTDVTGDGVDDLLFGAIDSTNGANAGAVKVFDPIPQGFARTTLGSERLDDLGRSIALLDDVNGDGVRDVLAATGGFTNSIGAARVYSGIDGSELRVHPGAAFSDDYAHSVIALPDLDGDSIGEYAISVPGPSGKAQGFVEIRSGASGNLIRSIAPAGGGGGFFGTGLAVGVQPSGAVDLGVAAPGLGQVFVFDVATGSVVVTASFGSSDPYGGVGPVAYLGDVDGDGVGDWAAGVPWASTDTLIVFSGSTGAAIKKLSKAGTNLGYSVAGPGDVDGDGVPDLVAGSPGETHAKGAVYLYSGATWRLLRSWTGTDYGLGASVTAVGDVNGDGFGDFIMGQRSRAFLVNGATGATLYRFDGDVKNYDYFGYYGAGVAAPGSHGSMNGDAIPDVAIGAPHDSTLGNYCGRLSLYFLDDLYLQIDPAAAAAGQKVSFTTSGGPGGKLAGLFVVGLDGAPRFELLSVGTLDSTGVWSLSGAVPPGLAGHTIDFESITAGFVGKLAISQPSTLVFQ